MTDQTARVPGTSTIRHETFVFREPDSPDELARLLRLRRRAYEGSAVSALEPASSQGYNLDYYDLAGRHFGLYVDRGDRDEPIGYLRIVENAPRAFEQNAWALAEHHPCRQTIVRRPDAPLPIFSYWPEGEALRRAYRANGGDDATIFEGSRLSLLPDWRCLRLAALIIELAIAYVFSIRGGSAAFLGCQVGHRGFYGRRGFRNVVGTTKLKPRGFPEGCCLELKPSFVPPAVAALAAARAGEWTQTGCVRIAPRAEAA